MLNINTPEVQFALDAVCSASLLVRQIQAEMVRKEHALTKKDLSPVTIADYASQALVGRLLIEKFPSDPMVAEEDSAMLRAPESAPALEAVTHFVSEFQKAPLEQQGTYVTTSDVCEWIDTNRMDSAYRFWTLDPIDGTKGFLRGDQYVVALALIVDSRVQIGVLGCPNLVDGYRRDIDGVGSLVIAVRDQGAWLTNLADPVGLFQAEKFRPLHVSDQNNAEEARILRSFESGHTNVDQVDQFVKTLGVKTEAVRMDSQAKYAVLAAGHGEMLLRLLSPYRPDYKETIWDQAAGSLVLEEAGGRITDLHGRELDFSTGRYLLNNRGILATNNLLHQSGLKALQQIMS
jgi:3'(2'), 5'-bisphosphate nucleotidase